MSVPQPSVTLRYIGPLAKISTPSGPRRRVGDTWAEEGEAEWPADIAADLVAGGDWTSVKTTTVKGDS